VVAFAITYNAVAVALSLAGVMNPVLAAVLMPASSLVSLAIVLAGIGALPRSAARSPRRQV
jgi:Cu2+-exporting ATPase